jgi:uncharacterized protein (UPF0332 family)
MRPESAELIAYARKLMGDANRMIASDLPDHAARTAYLACFHCARAYAFERGAQSAKTHRGVQSEFFRLSKDDSRVDPELRAFLSRAYTYKATADYETGIDNTTTLEEARRAVAIAGRFVTEFARLTPLPDVTA